MSDPQAPTLPLRLFRLSQIQLADWQAFAATPTTSQVRFPPLITLRSYIERPSDSLPYHTKYNGQDPRVWLGSCWQGEARTSK